MHDCVLCFLLVEKHNDKNLFKVWRILSPFCIVCFTFKIPTYPAIMPWKATEETGTCAKNQGKTLTVKKCAKLKCLENKCDRMKANLAGIANAQTVRPVHCKSFCTQTRKQFDQKNSEKPMFPHLPYSQSLSFVILQKFLLFL